MYAGEPGVISSFGDVRAAWSSWGMPAFCTALRWCLKGAWWEAVQRPPTCRCCLCPFAPLGSPPWVAPQSCQGLTGMDSRSARVPGANSPLLQTSLDCGRRRCEELKFSSMQLYHSYIYIPKSTRAPANDYFHYQLICRLFKKIYFLNHQFFLLWITG